MIRRSQSKRRPLTSSNKSNVLAPATMALYNAPTFDNNSSTTTSTAEPVVDPKTTTPLRQPPSHRETLDNLNPMIRNKLNAPKSELKQVLQLVDFNANVNSSELVTDIANSNDNGDDAATQSLINEVTDDVQLRFDGQRFSHQELDSMHEAMSIAVNEPDKYGKGGILFFRNVKKLMQTNRSAKSLRNKFSRTIKEKGSYGHSAFAKINYVLRKRRSEKAGSTRMARLEQYTEQLAQMKQRREEAKAKEMAQKQEKEEALTKLVTIMTAKLSKEDQVQNASEKAECNPLQKDIMCIMDLLDDAAEAVPPRCTKLQYKAVQNMLKKDETARSLCIEYQRLLRRHGMSRFEIIVEKIIDFAAE